MEMEMDQQTKYSKAADILDLYFLSSAVDSRSGVKNHLSSQILKPQENQGAAVLSEEEWKIRGELERDIERDLEEEIKDGIYRLALRLHRFYRHKRERKNGQNFSESGDHKKDKTLSEVNISIKMEGGSGTKIEIKETKKEAVADQHYRHQKGSLPDHLPPGSRGTSRSSNNVNVQAMLGSNGNKKFDWAKSLRDGAGPSIFISGRIERLDQAKIKIPNNDRGFCMNNNQLEHTRRNLDSASGQRLGNIGLDNKKDILEQGWKC